MCGFPLSVWPAHLEDKVCPLSLFYQGVVISLSHPSVLFHKHLVNSKNNVAVKPVFFFPAGCELLLAISSLLHLMKTWPCFCTWTHSTVNTVPLMRLKMCDAEYEQIMSIWGLCHVSHSNSSALRTAWIHFWQRFLTALYILCVHYVLLLFVVLNI